MASEILGFAFFQNLNVALLATGLEEYHGSAVTSGTSGTTDSVEVVVFAEWRVVFDHEVDIRKIEPACGDIGTYEYSRILARRKGFQRACSCGLLQGAMQAEDFDIPRLAAGQRRSCAFGSSFCNGVSLGNLIPIDARVAVLSGLVLLSDARYFVLYSCCLVPASQKLEMEVDTVCAAHEDDAFQHAAFALELLFESSNERDQSLLWWHDRVALLELSWRREVVLYSFAVALCCRIAVHRDRYWVFE